MKLCGNPEMSFFFFFFFALQTLTSLLYFFLLEKSSWLLYIVMMLMMTMITYLLAVQGALLPACVCMKGVMTVWPNGGGCDEDNDDIGSVCVIATMLNVSFFLVHERFMRNVGLRAYVCVCACFWTLICSSQGSEKDVNLTACIWEKGVCVFVWMCTRLRARLSGYCDS